MAWIGHHAETPLVVGSICYGFVAQLVCNKSATTDSGHDDHSRTPHACCCTCTSQWRCSSAEWWVRTVVRVRVSVWRHVAPSSPSSTASGAVTAANTTRPATAPDCPPTTSARCPSYSRYSSKDAIEYLTSLLLHHSHVQRPFPTILVAEA